MLKVVLDTNQFVSGAISKQGPSAMLLKAWREHAFILISSREILEEVGQALRYHRIAKKYGLKEERIQSILALIEHEAVILPEIPHVDIIKDDPDDNKILACALAAEADYIVSGDKHLLNLGRHKKTAIFTVGEFLKILQPFCNRP